MVIEQNRDRIIAWIAIPRTGTNFLCSLLNHHPLITSYYEIFHPLKFYAGFHNNPEAIIKHMNQQYLLNFSDTEDTNLIKWIHDNPTQLINILTDLSSEKYISFKLFPNHLKDSQIKLAIIKNKNIKKILVKRNLLDAYTSHEIALKTNQWNNFNTSEIHISLSVEKFAKWIKWAKQWYDFFENSSYLKKNEYFIINYEDIHAHKTNTDKLIYVDNFLKSIGIKIKQNYQIPNIDSLKMMKKQDTRKNLAEKITNYQEFTKELENRGLYLNCE